MPNSTSRPIRLALIGVGNCASSLVQGIEQFRTGAHAMTGLAHYELGGYRPSDIRIAAAWDIDRRKVGRDVADAIFAAPNCTQKFCSMVEPTGTIVRMGPMLDGMADHMADYIDDRTFVPAEASEDDRDTIVAELRGRDVDVMINYLPVGSEAASRFYAGCALEAGVAFVNAIPVFLASDPDWAARFEAAGVPIIGDDIKAELGATIVHRVLTDLFHRRGVKLDRTYQLNTGGNTDFLNMSARSRLASKKISKTEAVQSVTAQPLAEQDIHIGPSDYVAWQNDNKIAFIRMEGQLFGGVPMNLELRLSVEDSPNSAGVAIDMIRCAMIARDRGLSGPIDAPSACFCKHPPRQQTDAAAWDSLDAYLEDA